MLEAKSLRKAVVPSTLIQNPSPGNLQSTRLALHVSQDGSSCAAYIASGCLVYKLEISMEDSSLTKGKNSLLIPMHAEVTHASLVNRCPHRSEIQSVVLAETDRRIEATRALFEEVRVTHVYREANRAADNLSKMLPTAECVEIVESSFAEDLKKIIFEDKSAFAGNNRLILGTVDSYGHLFVSRLVTSGQDIDRLTYSVLPRDNWVGEGSWAGLCFSPSQWSMAAVARSFSKSIDIYDQDIHLRSLHTLWYPSSLGFLQNSFSGNECSILAVAEGSQLTIWDLRMKENGGCIHRICGSLGDIFYAVCSSSAGHIAVGGADRTVSIYDPRRWSTLARWVKCSKYEITGLAFSSLDENHMYIQGVDYEVFCGNWNENEKVFSFRGDSNWLGFSKCPSKDVVGGWSDSGSIFVAEITTKQHDVNYRNSNDSL